MNSEIIEYPAASFVAVEQSPKFVPGPYTLESFDRAGDYAVFQGHADDPGPVAWAVFDLEGCTAGNSDAASFFAKVDVFDRAPMRDDDACADLVSPRGDEFDDMDAALAYLRAGGALCKVPDCEGSKYYRLMVVNVEVSPDGTPSEPETEAEKTIAQIRETEDPHPFALVLLAEIDRLHLAQNATTAEASLLAQVREWSIKHSLPLVISHLEKGVEVCLGGYFVGNGATSAIAIGEAAEWCKRHPFGYGR